MTQEDSSGQLTYKDAGVDITAGKQLVDRIKPAVKSTARSGVLGSIGGFGGLFELPLDKISQGKYKAPVLVSGTDGVGTKLRLAIDAGNHTTIGIDLVAMCVNDIIVTGAEPLFFLDYFATGKLDVDQGATIIEGIAVGCIQAGAALIGGESAEMPGLYKDGDYDLAGFAVGLVEKTSIIDGASLQAGDAIIGLASSGPHSNGFSLIHAVLEASDSDLNMPFEESDQNSEVDDPTGGKTLSDVLLEPTRIYVKSILQAIEAGVDLKALAHITGGGLTENIPRVLKPGLQAQLYRDRWTSPPVFEWLQNTGNISTEEMHRVFNCGIGMVAFVPSAEIDRTLDLLRDNGETAWHIGEVIAGAHDEPPTVVIH